MSNYGHLKTCCDISHNVLGNIIMIFSWMTFVEIPLQLRAGHHCPSTSCLIAHLSCGNCSHVYHIQVGFKPLWCYLLQKCIVIISCVLVSLYHDHAFVKLTSSGDVILSEPVTLHKESSISLSTAIPSVKCYARQTG